MRRPETIKYFTQEEFSRLLKVMENKRDQTLILLAYRYALHASEAKLSQ